ncbi:MAG: (E)-4-hydroxy-3-methylbut-2-enyl-diphosphate synthase [Chitinophagaceae bacterium]
MQRLKTREVKIGHITIGGNNPIAIQTMTTTDTMDTEATVAQTIRCVEHGADFVRITAPSKNEAENLLLIKNELRNRNIQTPLIADIHFTPNAAEIAATIVEKVRINPGNYIDKKKFEQIEYTDQAYQEEIERIKKRFSPLIAICKKHETAIRIGTNHGSLSDRIMSRYGDTPMGMVESAMEFLRIARSLDFHQIVLSMKSSNPQVMIEAYRLLVHTMQEEFGECYPLHLGVTEAGDGEDGRIKSAIGIGTLLSEGIGDTIRVSLTEEPELELPVCKNIVALCAQQTDTPSTEKLQLRHDVFQKPFTASNFQYFNTPRVVIDTSKKNELSRTDFALFGYYYDEPTNKWHIADQAADYIFCNQVPRFALPATVGILTYYQQWLPYCANKHCYPLFDILQYIEGSYIKHESLNFVMIDANINAYQQSVQQDIIQKLKSDRSVVLCISSQAKDAIYELNTLHDTLVKEQIKCPYILICDSNEDTIDKALISYSVQAGGMLLDHKLHGLCLGFQFENRAISETEKDAQIKQLHSISFSILQATRTRISKTEYISCPSCGRTLFDLQETTAKIRAVTNHLKGVKIAIMGCIVNGPGEMADADFGYVGSGVNKITLYKNKEIVKRNIDSQIAVDELINLLKENGVWVERTIN